MRRTPLERSGWKRAASTTLQRPRDREQRLLDRAEAAIKTVVPRASVMAASTTRCAPAPKDELIRSKIYLRLVAQLPCKHCGISGHSQAAHANTGKGMGTKACDLQTFPLCADRPGQRGCHSLFDQGALLGKEARRAIEPAWVADTQRQIYALGLWPKKLTIPEAVHVKN